MPHKLTAHQVTELAQTYLHLVRLHIPAAAETLEMVRQRFGDSAAYHAALALTDFHATLSRHTTPPAINAYAAYLRDCPEAFPMVAAAMGHLRESHTLGLLSLTVLNESAQAAL